MDLVLGLAMTSRAVRWVLVEGTTGEGRPFDRGAISFDDAAVYDPDGLLRGLVDDTELEAGHRIHAIGVTWTNDAAPLAGRIMQSLDTRGYGNVFAVSEIEAAGMLASGIAEITEHDDIAVCIVEPDAAVVSIVTPDDVSADRIERSETFVADITGLLALTGRPISAMFVLGSDAHPPLVTELAESIPASVITAAESDLAFARGAGLAAALAVNTVDTPPKRVHWTKVGALTSVVGGALVTLVVASSAAIGLHLHPGAVSETAQAASIQESAPEAGPAPKPVQKPADKPAAKPAVKPAPAAPAAPPPAQAVEAANPPAQPPPAHVPPAPAAPAPEPAPAYVPPAPAPVYTPPPAPVYTPPPYVPPPVTYPQPRLRDRIIERIPIINRFH
ncbi:hypothetical protein A5746_13025 [Mycolicibacterium conceptionense]|uniref:DUF7159 family protein n=1 Tax=Mycolicibacterium conceptionense TaxID=451644 RepID=UPI0007EDE242|nr:hypothetical protein [Mycolicibacterium conceptionense]OBJ98301.1 hypothetical protein A5639_29425 [Mycolicibacterium conceptionense]OMB72708.1 hypothetical protein A5741_05690 [Mycolicibacterium conceptionense]OMC00001.1 hypothetical protein A5746_13025 [Mycolicibacterium conceptionense]